jgi:hypothetical protein
LGFIQPEIGLVYHKFKELISNWVLWISLRGRNWGGINF